MAIASAHTRGGGRGADGNVIGMSIAAIRPKGNHRLGSEAADDLVDLAVEIVLVNLLEPPVSVVQAHSVLNTNSLAG